MLQLERKTVHQAQVAMHSADDDGDHRAPATRLPPLQQQRAGVTLGAVVFAALVAHQSQAMLLLAAISTVALLLLIVCPSSVWAWLQLRLGLSALATLAAAREDETTSDDATLGKIKRQTKQQTTTTSNSASRASDGGERAAAIRPPAPAMEVTPAGSSTPTAPTSFVPTTIRRRSKLAVPTALTPSLRVVDLGVDADGAPLRLDAPTELLGDFVVEPNAETPYEFENDFVRGKLLFLLNHHQDTNGEALPARIERIFRGKRRLFWVQMQLQFKKAPSGILYIGGEVPRAMNLGFFTGGLAKIILSVLQSLVRGLHYGFGVLYPGAAATRADEELPHICFPLYTAVDQFVCTPAGAEPPALGSLDFGETKEASLARRKSGGALFAYNTTDTYSFHFHSYFIDFSRWKLQNVPGMRDVDLSAFWSDMPLQLVAYSLKPQPNIGSDAKKAVHSLRAKEYKFCFELSHRVQKQLCSADDGAGSAAIVGDEATQFEELQRELRRFTFSLPAWFEYFSSSSMHSERRVGYVLLVCEHDDEDSTIDAASSSQQRAVKSKYMVLHTALFAYGPLSYIEHELGAASRKHGIFTFSSTPRQAKKKKRTLEESISVRSRSSKHSKIEDERQFLEFHLKQLAGLGADTAAAAGSRVRSEQLFAAQSALLDGLQNKRTSLHDEWPFLSSSCCRANSHGFESSSSSNFVSSVPQRVNELKDAPHAAVQVVRVVTASRWRHEWLTLDRSNRVLRFFRTMTSTHSFSIPLDQVLSVSRDNCPPLRSNENAGHDDSSDHTESAGELFWMHIGLLEKCHHVAFGSKSEREWWIASITETIEANVTTYAPRSSVMETRLQQPIAESSERLTLETFAGGSSDGTSKSRGRFVLNDRCDFVVHATEGSSSNDDPIALVAQSLRLVLALQSRRLQAGSTRDLIAFLHEISALQWADMSSLRDGNEDVKKAFFLNLFHLIQIHASVLGFLPKSKMQWSKFFNGVSYCVGGMLFSLAEIEHSVIRAPMAPLRLPIAFLVIPRFHPEHDERAAFQLKKQDFRLNFALNCMTKSCADSIAVYNLALLEAQLDHIVQETVDLSLTYDRESRVVYLPKACDWYRGDFVAAAAAASGSEGSVDVHASSVNLSTLRLLVPFVRGSKRELLEYVLSRQDALIAKYKFTKYDYRFQEAPLKEAML